MTTPELWGWVWWSIMLSISIFNICLMLYITLKRYWYKRKNSYLQSNGLDEDFFLALKRTSGSEHLVVHDERIKPQCALDVCAWIFVLVCAYRSILPRIDVPEICWFNTPLNYIIYGRAAATIAELGWAFQIAVVQYFSVKDLHMETCGMIASSMAVFAMAVVAECCSWTCLSTKNRLFCVWEESLWTLLFIVPCMTSIIIRKEIVRRKGRMCAPTYFGVGYRGYGIFLFFCFLAQALQVVLYATRYASDQKEHVVYDDFFVGLKGLIDCKNVTNDFGQWWQDAAWMTPYFSICVWNSIWLSAYPMILYQWV